MGGVSGLPTYCRTSGLTELHEVIFADGAILCVVQRESDGRGDGQGFHHTHVDLHVCVTSGQTAVVSAQ